MFLSAESALNATLYLTSRPTRRNKAPRASWLRRSLQMCSGDVLGGADSDPRMIPQGGG